jgi:cyclopropane fatty-acyl-phospholipid synthase-like methyltransferase
VTLGKNQTAFGNKRLRDNGVPESQGRILCMDFRDLPHPKGTFNKIVSLEMAEVSDSPFKAVPWFTGNLHDEDSVIVQEIVNLLQESAVSSNADMLKGSTIQHFLEASLRSLGR